jgi:16S rRNA C1402 N4-methylase RsmH
MSYHGRKIINDLARCKVEGICDRDKIASAYLAARVEAYRDRMQTINEEYRDVAELPRCPPVCPPLGHDVND